MKRFNLEDGTVALRWHGRSDPRGYVPPRGCDAQAGLIEVHPVTGRFLGESEWWIFLTRGAGRT
jgi:hypothetical protein